MLPQRLAGFVYPFVDNAFSAAILERGRKAVTVMILDARRK